MRNRSIQLLILIILLVGVGFVIYQNLAKDVESVQVKKKAPDFTMTTLAGDEVTLSQLEGKGVLINFWATYCEPCIREMPTIQAQYEKYKDKGIEVIGINTGENEVTVTGYVNRLGVQFPIILDKNYKIVDLYQTGPLPRSIFIDKEGYVQSIILGEMNEKIVEDNILRILP